MMGPAPAALRASVWQVRGLPASGLPTLPLSQPTVIEVGGLAFGISTFLEQLDCPCLPSSRKRSMAAVGSILVTLAYPLCIQV